MTLVTLIQIDPQNAAGGIVPLRLSSHDMPEACHLAGDQWEPALVDLPAFALDFFGGDFAGQVTAPGTGFAVATYGLSSFGSNPADRARFADARVRIWNGDITSPASADLGPLTLRFDGRITGEPEIDDAARLARFSAAVQDSWADNPLLPLFAGTGGLEGPADLTGQPEPLALGNVRFAGGVLIDNVDNIWMVSAGAVQGIGAAYDRLARLGPSSGNHANLAALKAASIPNGSWATCLAQGLVRFGAPPDGRVSFDVAGSNAGTGGYVRRPGAIIRRICDLAGGAVNAASLSGLDTARPYNLQLQLREQITPREVIARIADSVGAVAGVSLTGQLFAQPLGIGASGEVLNADGSAALPVSSVSELAKASPFWRLATEAELTFEVHSADEAAFANRWQGEYSASRVYRLDDVVTGPGSASWRYINSTATAGQALPIWPVTTNAYWENFSPPLAPGDIGIEDGATRNQDGGGNLIGTAIGFEGATYINGAGQALVNGQPAAQLQGAAFSAVIWSDWFPVRGGERLFFSYQAHSDVSNPDSIRAGYNWRDAAGNITPNDLPDTALLGTAAVGLGNTATRTQSGAIPGAAVAVQFFVTRPTWGGSGSFFVRRPLVSRAQPGATDGAPAGSLVGGVESSALVTQANNAASNAIAAYRPRQNLLFNGRFRLNLNGWENVTGTWRFVGDSTGRFVEQPLGTGGTFVLRSSRAIFAGPGSPLVISLQGFALNASVNDLSFADIEWRNGTNDTVLGFSSIINGNGAVISANVSPSNPAYNSQAITAPSPTDGSGFVRGFVRIVSIGTVAYATGGHVALGVKVEAGTTPTAISDEATDGAVLDNTFGRIRDPEAYNTQAILGPRNTTNLVPTYTVGGSNVTVNLPSHSRNIATRSGPRTLTYGASSGVVAFSTNWAAYVDDPELTGFASPTVTYTTNPNDLLFPGRYLIASGRTPASGGGGGSTSPGGGGPPVFPT